MGFSFKNWGLDGEFFLVGAVFAVGQLQNHLLGPVPGLLGLGGGVVGEEGPAGGGIGLQQLGSEIGRASCRERVSDVV